MQEKIFKGIFALCALLSIFAVLMICFFLFANAIPTITQIGLFDFIFGLDWYPTEEIFGIFPMIVGSIYVTALAILIGVPLGVLSAIYLSRFASKKEQKYILPAVELLGAIPSVVYGFFGLVVIVPLLATTFSGIPGKSVLAAALILSIMILPTIILVSKAAIDALPQSYYEGALALGASKERSVFFALIPAAKSGILASIILGVGRAIGEAMAVIMVAGNQALIPTSVLEGVRTLTTNIVLEMGYAQDLHREVLIANAVALFVFILLINTCFNALKKETK
ncbi:phosphate ABC transporter permease subunit PstC [Campylobacter upsaliensis]|uniref:phosphate ABC transporter permease subunit PstC n=1 Tax=Campylobacter upsaliensis TaxID=28080 RepID=UPI00004B3EBA|nr:phosphate ABC transporter permease subunit PstC [Campylobacter upsaliensis]EAL53748.1 phosphate ABC transporter, permease protein [Campylobacter upsaliensis RM3195]MCR2101740.1 phosphate ABC transporter permease subunit PstC [Campylobacter upsaliensis]MCR2112872.1 phosphate ABC transporter permease subunit PstC [Campylobacter upsaliensis]MCR2119640.1 phosphate ABC transporter permease subunit PstC [Campylobacter upsaliensis]MCR2121841.1 phosphate ABC transporter permease subunit PstC [Campy